MADRFRQKNPKNRKTKIKLVFDEESRNEFLTGFHKRKLERKKYHQDKLAAQHKDQVKQMRRERKKAMEESFPLDITFREEMMRNDLSKKADVHELPDHTVTVTSVTDIDLNPEGQHLGLNEVEYESEPEEEEEEEEEDDFGFPKNFEEASKRVMKKKEEPPEENEEEAARMEARIKRQKIFDRQRKVKQKMRQKKRKTPSAIRGKKGKKVATSRKHINYHKKR
ncbi:uncharacterized protein [Apostichopus japonicus]